jgi:hypothetical protein
MYRYVLVIGMYLYRYIQLSSFFTLKIFCSKVKSFTEFIKKIIFIPTKFYLSELGLLFPGLD